MIKQLLTKSLAATLAALVACPAPLWAQAAGAAKTPAVESLVISEDKVVIKLTEEAQYKSFMTANPPRLVVEIVGAEYQAGAKAFAGKGTVLKGVRGGQFKPKPEPVSRIVLDLTQTTTYSAELQGTDLVVVLAPAKDSGSAPAPAVTQAEGAPKAPASPSPEAKPSTPAPAAAPKPKIAAPAAATSEAPTRAAPVKRPIEPAKSYGSQIAQTAPTSDAAREPGSFATENNPDLEAMAKAKAVEAGEAAPAPRLDGAAKKDHFKLRPHDIMGRLPRDPVTLDFDNTDVRDVIRLLATKANVNIIYGADVTGTLTLHLTDVPFNEAFRSVLMMTGLTTIQIGDSILRILTPAQMTRAQASQAQTLATKVIPLSYAKAAELVTAVNQIRQGEGRMGMALADPKTNSLVVTESVEGLSQTERIITQLDQRPQQVLIEAKLVEVGLNNSLHYGIQWDYTQVDQGRLGGQLGTNTIGTTAGPGASATNIPVIGGTAVNGIRPFDNNATNTSLITGGQGQGHLGRGTGVGLPASQIFGAMTLGRITNNYFINATLTAAAAQGKVKVLSDPKIATINNVPANINVTTQIPYVTSNVASTGVQTQTVSYAVTGIQLAVTPTINADGRITLQINPNVSQPSATAAASAVTGAPAIDSRSANTTVVVKDGETIVIGGLISDSVSNQVAKIPILGDIPILGWLFKKKSVVRNRAELLIFVTPKILVD